VRRALAAIAAAGLWLALPAIAAPAPQGDLPPADGRAPAVDDSKPRIESSLDLAIPRHVGDLDRIVATRQIRMLVAHDRTHFYFDGGRQTGIVADAVQQFERWLNARLGRLRTQRIHAVVVPVPRSELIPALLDGRGDVIATPLAATAEHRAHVAFAIGGASVGLVLAQPRAVAEPPGVESLAGTEIHVRERSAGHAALLELNARLVAAGLPAIRVRLLDPNLDTDEALGMVDAGLIPATLAESYVARVWAPTLPNVRLVASLGFEPTAPLGWAVRPDSPQLLDTVGAFQQQHRIGTLWGNVKRREYFTGGERIRNPIGAAERRRLQQVGTLFRRYSESYSLDWLLVTAQAFQESGLDHSRRSRVGAIGIMQMMPTTARDPRIAIPDVEKLDRNIEAGTKYLRFVMDRYFADPSLTPLDRTLFALASYNAGPARVARLRAEARESGLDPNVWFGNVEIVAARRVGAETVDYVRNIYKYYLAYRLLADQASA
jgi:membrane-bound lytic murein transglycosylase MltF